MIGFVPRAAAGTVVLALLLGSLGGVAAPAQPRPKASAAPGDALTCTPLASDLDHLSPLHASEAQIAALLKSYASPEVVGLRTELNRVVAGTADPESAQTMQGVAPSLLANRFVLLSDDSGVFGGYWIVFQFRNHPDEMYRTWIYGRGATSREAPFAIRAWDRTECTPLQQRWLDVRYGELSKKMPGV